jgi:branched-subunit amino acid ABC-type transport system permease component
MKKFAKKHLITIIGVAIGAVAGCLYWQFIGCSTGSCAITSNPINSTLYGAAMGGLLLSTFKKDKKAI